MKPLTAYEREIVANIFKKAKVILEKGQCDYICAALGWTFTHGTLGYPEDYKAFDPEGYKAFDLARSIVMERLEGQPSLEGWLNKQGFCTKLTSEREQKLRNHRLQWLDLLIAEFEGEKS